MGEEAHSIMTIDECESLDQDDYTGKNLNETMKTEVESITTQNTAPIIITQDSVTNDYDMSAQYKKSEDRS